MATSKKELALIVEQMNELLELRLPECLFYWRVSTGGCKVGSRAGTLDKDGYTVIRINGKLFRAHRLVWFVTYGKFPEGVIDHIDGDPSNNRIENLRNVTHKVNNQNRPKQNRCDANLPTGVAVVRRNKLGEPLGYRAYWLDMEGKRCQVYHGIKEHCTAETAVAAAIARRELEMSKLITQGAAYTERHGK